MTAAGSGPAAPDGLGQAPVAALVRALGAAAHASRLLVASDFDGVIAPFNADPMAVQPTDGVMETLRQLTGLSGVTVAVVSGRDLATLARLSGVSAADRIILVGSHGAESTDPSVREAMEASAVTGADLARLDSLESAVRELLTTRHPEARVERKAAGIVVHTRGLPDAVAVPALEETRSLGESQQGVRILQGKAVLELSVSPADKGSALAALSAAMKATARVYLGDDVTDEDVFTRFDDPADVPIKVGPGATAARYRIPDTDAVAALLADLLRRREDGSGSS